MSFRQLTTCAVDPLDNLLTPDEAATVTLRSPALEVFTDFQHYRPLVIDRGVSVADAEEIMKRTHVRLKLVVDEFDKFIGTLSYHDLIGPRFQHLIGEAKRKQDITVADVMTPSSELRAIAYADLELATIGDIVETLRREHRQHFLVTDVHAHGIRGIFSASDIARRLHVAVDISQAPSFAEICHAIISHAPENRTAPR